MKKLKLEHQLAELVRKGKKTVTWRLYDDNDIQVNDIVGLIDKVEPGNPETWVHFADVRIDSIVQERLSDITAQDYQGHESFDSPQQLLETYRSYYGPDVGSDTPVKMIRFTVLEEQAGIHQPTPETENH